MIKFNQLLNTFANTWPAKEVAGSNKTNRTAIS